MIPRYNPDKGSMVQSDKGTYVAFSDYERLCSEAADAKAEIARANQMFKSNREEIDRLRAEVASLKDHVALQGKLIDDAEAVMRRQVAERDRLRKLLLEARSMWVDDHSNLAKRIDDQPQDEDCTCVGFHTGACKEER